MPVRFPPSFLEEIKLKLPVSDVVRRRVKLAKSGREWKGLSPFNQERTPSFFVNDQKMAWFDLSAGKNGNIFDFVMQTEGLSFPEAVERLASDAGLALPILSKEAEAQEQKRASLHEVLALAAQFFRAQFLKPAGFKARAYVAGRQIAENLQEEFQIGYAPPEKYALRDHLAAKGASKDMMIEAGLLIHGEEIAVPYDRFRDRLMFPIHDRSGRVVAFGGRALTAEAQPKYLNSPETPLFHKSSLLYNHHRARKAAHNGASVIAVEGYIDVIAMYGAGFPATVASLGTALTPEHCELMWQMAEVPVLCFDGDKAGRKAAFRALDLALPLIAPGRSLRFALLAEGEDPDDLARTKGKAGVEEAIGKALPLVELLWQREIGGARFETPEAKAGLEKRFETLSFEIRDNALRRYYLSDFRARLRAFFAPSQSVARQPRAAAPKPFERQGSAGRFRGRVQDPFERARDYKAPLTIGGPLAASALLQTDKIALPLRDALILLLLLRHPALIDSHYEEIAGLEFADTAVQELCSELLATVSMGKSEEDMTAAPTQQKYQKLIAKLENHPSLTGQWFLQPDSAYSDAELVLHQALTLHRKSKALHKELMEAEVALADEPSSLNLDRLKDIQMQISALPGIEAAIEGFGLASGRASGSL